MKTPTLNRFSSLNLRNNHTIKNRVVVPPMASETADTQGMVTEKTLDHYSRLTQSKAGLVLVEYSYIHQSGKSESNQLGIDSDKNIEGLTRLAKVIQSSGALAGIQLTHSGGKSETCFTNGPLQSPSGIVVPVKDKILETPISMDLIEIQNWKRWFFEAVTRAVQAKFDFIEIHAAHGYGINQWLSPITNKRDDLYGGNLVNNTRILLEIIEDIKSSYPQLLISVRMPGQDFIEDGLSSNDSILIAQMLEDAGVDIINISSGIGGWRRPRDRSGEGYLVDEAIIIQQHLFIPVIGVGGIESGNYIDELITNNKVSLTAVGRAILKDPSDWGKNHLGDFHYA